jgi:ABC-type branched-subunit amino acid transport system substrate-binding protein
MGIGLSGGFWETAFQDLLQLHSSSGQTAALHIHLRAAGDSPDGVFYFQHGNLVEAALAGASGREAIRQALRLTSGRFQVEVGVTPPPRQVRENLQLVLMEEVVKLDEERRVLPLHPVGAASQQHPTPPAPLHRDPFEVTIDLLPLAPSDANAAPRPGIATSAPASAQPRAQAVAPAAVRGARAATAPFAAPAPQPSGAPAPVRAVRPILSPPPRPRRRPAVLVATAAVLLLAAGLGGAALLRRAPAPALSPKSAAVPAAPAELLLGMTASLTGSNKEGGRAMKLGWEVALAAVNARGGIHGHRLRLVAIDDQYDPAQTGGALAGLVEKERVLAVVGSVGTANAAVAVPYCLERRVLFYGPMSGAEFLRKNPPDRYVFTYRASLAEEAAAAVRYLAAVKRVPAAQIAVLVQQDGFGDAGWKGAEQELVAQGARREEILRLEYARNTADVRDALAKLRAARQIKAAVLVATYKPAATFIRKAKDLRRGMLFVSVSPDSNGLAEQLVGSGPRATEDVVVTQVVPLPTSNATGVQRYRQALETYAPGEAPGSTTLEGWIAAQVFLAALEKVGPAPDGDKLVAALESIDHLDLGTGAPLGFNARSHQASHKVWGWALERDGTYRSIELD